jgi:hypothetical protein
MQVTPELKAHTGNEKAGNREGEPGKLCSGSVTSHQGSVASAVVDRRRVLRDESAAMKGEPDSIVWATCKAATHSGLKHLYSA